MSKSGNKVGGVAALNALLAGKVPDDEPKELTPEEIEAKVKKVMDVVATEGERDMFLMQAIVAECEEILRGDIQDAFYAEEPETRK